MTRETDPAFPFLDALDDTVPAVLAACAGALAPDLEPDGVRLVRHKRGRRCLVHYRFRAPDGARVGIFGKARAKGLDTRAERTQRLLFERGLDMEAPDGVMVPETLGRSEPLKMWFQRAVPGETGTALFVPGADPTLARRAAEALVRLHRTDLGTTRRWTIEDEIGMLKTRLAEARDARPSLAAPIVFIGMLARTLAARLPVTTATGIHRDFYPDQLLFDGRRVAIVDLDLHARGDAALDAGNFLAHLTELALRRHGSPEALAPLEAAFTARFRELSPEIPAEAIAIHAALSLARHVSISIRIPERNHLTGRIAELALDRLAMLATPPSAGRRLPLFRESGPSREIRP